MSAGSAEWQAGFDMRKRGEDLIKPYSDHTYDGWLTADAEAGHCTEMCCPPDDNGEDDPDLSKHSETCAIRWPH